MEQRHVCTVRGSRLPAQVGRSHPRARSGCVVAWRPPYVVGPDAARCPSGGFASLARRAFSPEGSAAAERRTSGGRGAAANTAERHGACRAESAPCPAGHTASVTCSPGRPRPPSASSSSRRRRMRRFQQLLTTTIAELEPLRPDWVRSPTARTSPTAIPADALRMAIGQHRLPGDGAPDLHRAERGRTQGGDRRLRGRGCAQHRPSARPRGSPVGATDRTRRACATPPVRGELVVSAQRVRHRGGCVPGRPQPRR